MSAEPGATRVALVTGASRGIGEHIARALLDVGWSVAALVRSTGSLRGLVDEFGDAVLPLTADVTDLVEVDRAVEQTLERLGPISLVVNNAGAIETEVPLWEADPDEWWRVIEVNVRGPFLLTRAVVPAMLAGGGGRVININSGAATAPRADLSAYTASKAALARLTGAVDASAASDGVYAFDLSPGVVRTDMTLGMAMHEGRTEWTEPADVTALVLAIAGGSLDAWSGRMIRAGVDSPASLQARAERGLADADRTIGLIPWGEDDPLG